MMAGGNEWINFVNDKTIPGKAIAEYFADPIGVKEDDGLDFAYKTKPEVMTKKDKSLLGSIFKGTIDITADILKASYDVAEEVVKTGYKAVTLNTARKIYKKTGDAAVDLMRFTPPKKKLTKIQLMNYLTKEEEHIKDTYNSLLRDHLNTDYNEKQYSKFRTHWRAICTQMVFGALAKKSAADYFEMKDYLEKELNKKDPEIMALVRGFYSNAYATGGLDTARILNSQCFNDKLSEEAVDEFNRGFALIHQTMVEGLK